MGQFFRVRDTMIKYYFIASVRDDENHDSRCWGFFTSKDKAIQAVTENWTDMNEAGYYKYAVIEPHYEGLINPIIGEDIWFVAKYDKEKKMCLGYEQCEKPKFAEGFSGWTIS